MELIVLHKVSEQSMNKIKSSTKFKCIILISFCI